MKTLYRINGNTVLLVILLLLVKSRVQGQTGSNEYFYSYYYELKDSNKQYTELIHISNLLSRKFKYYYLISKELGLDIRLKMPLESEYPEMKYKLDHPNRFESDSVNQNSINECFEDLLDPLVMEISKPKKESNLLLKKDSILINVIQIKTNESFKKNDNYRYSVYFSHDDPSPRHVKLKGYFNKGRLEIINGFFFFEDISTLLKDSISIKYNNFDFANNIDLYTKLLEFRNIEYNLKKNIEHVEVYFPLYKFNIKLEKANIAFKIHQLIKGGNLYETLMKLHLTYSAKKSFYNIKTIQKKSNKETSIDSNSFSIECIDNQFRIINNKGLEDINTDTQYFYRFQDKLFYHSDNHYQDSMLIIDLNDSNGTNTNFTGIIERYYQEELENVKSYKQKDTTIRGILYYQLLFKYNNTSGNFKKYVLLEKETLLPYYLKGEYGYSDKKRGSVEYILR